MQEYQRLLNARDSFHKTFEAAIASTVAKWALPKANGGMGRAAITVTLQEEGEIVAVPNPIFDYQIFEDSIYDELSMKDLMLIQVDLLVPRRDIVLSRFLRSHILQSLQLGTDKADKVAYPAYNNYVKDVNNPITEGSLVLSPQGGVGWRRIFAGQDGSKIKDPNVIHHFITLTIKY